MTKYRYFKSMESLWNNEHFKNGVYDASIEIAKNGMIRLKAEW